MMTGPMGLRIICEILYVLENVFQYYIAGKIKDVWCCLINISQAIVLTYF